MSGVTQERQVLIDEEWDRLVEAEGWRVAERSAKCPRCPEVPRLSRVTYRADDGRVSCYPHIPGKEHGWTDRDRR